MGREGLWLEGRQAAPVAMGGFGDKFGESPGGSQAPPSFWSPLPPAAPDSFKFALLREGVTGGGVFGCRVWMGEGPPSGTCHRTQPN